MRKFLARALPIRTWQYLLFFVLSCFPYGDTHFSGPMQNSVVDLTAAIVESGRFSIDEYAENSPDVAWKDGHFYSGLAPGLSFLAVPVYAVARGAVSLMPGSLERLSDRLAKRAAAVTGRSLTPRHREIALTHFLLSLLLGGAAGAVSVLLVKRVSAHLLGNESVALQIALTYAFGTIMVYYTASYFTQSVATCMLLGAIYILFVQDGPRHLVWGGLLAGLAAVTDYPYFVYGGLVVFFAIGSLRWRDTGRGTALRLIAAFALPLALAALYHQSCFGNWFQTGYRYRAVVPFHSGSASLGIAAPSLGRIRALLFSVDEGVLFLFPFAFLAPLGLWHHLRRGRRGAEIEVRPSGRPLVVLMALLLATSALYFTSIPWRSDMGAYGPRFFLCGIALLPFFSYPVDRRLRPIFFGLVAYSVVINHLHLIGLRPWHLLGAWLSSAEIRAQSVVMFPPLIRFPWLRGVAIDLCYQTALAGFIFLWPSWNRSRRRPDSPSPGDSPGQDESAGAVNRHRT